MGGGGVGFLGTTYSPFCEIMLRLKPGTKAVGVIQGAFIFGACRGKLVFAGRRERSSRGGTSAQPRLSFELGETLISFGSVTLKGVMTY